MLYDDDDNDDDDSFVGVVACAAESDQCECREMSSNLCLIWCCMMCMSMVMWYVCEQCMI